MENPVGSSKEGSLGHSPRGLREEGVIDGPNSSEGARTRAAALGSLGADGAPAPSGAEEPREDSCALRRRRVARLRSVGAPALNALSLPCRVGALRVLKRVSTAPRARAGSSRLDVVATATSARSARAGSSSEVFTLITRRVTGETAGAADMFNVMATSEGDNNWSWCVRGTGAP